MNVYIKQGGHCGMKLRIGPIVATAALSAVLLFGGWHLYRHYGIEQPLDRLAKSVPGVQSAETELNGNEVVLKVGLAADADLAEVYRKVTENGASSLGGRTLQLVVEGKPSDKLEQIWSQALFDVAQAMDRSQYSDIREAMRSLMKQYPGLTAVTEMDEHNVYVTLRSGNEAKFVVLPRQPAKIGVWPDA
jgi:hypothetical protein